MRLATVVLLLCGLCHANWPMLGHDAGRSGSTATEIRPPFARKWYRLFPDEGIQSGVQPIVSGGRVYVGTLRGKLRAIDAQTGQDAWVYDAGAPILHSAACDGQRVYAGTGGGEFHAVNVNGTRAWRRKTGGVIWNAPLVHDKAVYFADHAGVVYALKGGDGAPVWMTDLKAPVRCSPAIDAKGGRLYVGAEDMRVYAIELKSGFVRWSSPKLPGVSMRGYHPVIAPDGSVMMTTTPLAGGDAIQQVLLDMVKDVFGNFSSWRIKSKEEKERIRAENFELMKKPETYQKQLEYLRKRLAEEPGMQTFFVLDKENGKQKFVAPIVYAESMNGPGSPPIVTADGKVIVKYNALLRSRYEHYSPFLNVGYLDTASGHITPIMDQSRTYGWHDSLLLVHDEQSQLMSAGRMLINTHQDNINAMNLDTLKGEGQPWANGVHEVKPGVAASLWATHLHAKELPVGWEWLARGTAVYGGGSVIDVPIVVSGDSFYFLPTHEINAGVALVAYRMDQAGDASKKRPEPSEKLIDEDSQKIAEMKWDWDTMRMPRLDHALTGLPERPSGEMRPEEVKAAVAKITDTELDELILTPAYSATVRKIDAIDAKVEELLGSSWRPLLFPSGKHPAEAYRLFMDPTETLYTVALAYPYCDQERVKKQVGALIETGTFARRTYDSRAGEVRSFYDEVSERLLKMGNDPPRSETARIYPHWLWAHVSGDGSHIRAHWPAMKQMINPAAPKDEIDLGNGRISGLIAACRIARDLKDDTLNDLLGKTRKALRERLEYEFAHGEGGVMTRQQLRTHLGRWQNLSPDMAAVLRKFCLPIHRRLMDVYVDHHRPAWFVSWNVELLWRNENPFSFPAMSNSIFAAKALILGEKGMEKYLDVPWCRGDEYYIQKLVLSAE